MPLMLLGLVMFLTGGLGSLYVIIISHDPIGLMVSGFITILGILDFMYGWYVRKKESNYKLNKFANWFITH